MLAAAGNAMTTSVLAAGMFALLTHIVPTGSGNLIIPEADLEGPMPWESDSDASGSESGSRSDSSESSSD